MNLNKYLIKVTRKKSSFDYKYDKSKNVYKNNIKNNSLDKLELFFDDQYIIGFNSVQTVSNHPHFDHFDTIDKGPFRIQCFVSPRKFHGLIHGIIDAVDIEGQKIDHWSMQVEGGYQKGRWLVHDRWSFKKNRDLRNGYSGGCFILSSSDLKRFNEKLKKLLIKPGDILNGILVEVD